MTVLATRPSRCIRASACLSTVRIVCRQAHDVLLIRCSFSGLHILMLCNNGAPSRPLARQVLDFIALKERLEQSHTRAVARAESAVYQVQVAASGAVAKGDFAGARLAALEALSDLQQAPDAAKVRGDRTNLTPNPSV